MSNLRDAALALYRPPFRDDGGGYVFDSESAMVSDQDRGINETQKLVAARVRGWGRIQNIVDEHSPEDLQDEFTRVLADSLNTYYKAIALRSGDNQQLRLMCGELTAHECMSIRAVLNYLLA